MNRTKEFASITLRQLTGLRNAVTGRPVMTPPFVAATLDEDDVRLATRLRADSASWHDRSAVSEFETQFAEWNGSRHAFGFMGGRVSLSACIYALGLGEGDEVILPAFTCVVVANAFAYAGVKVVWADIELDAYGLDADDVAARITPRTRAIVIQHTFGLVGRDFERLLELARSRDLFVIEDCAHATGATFNDLNVGNFGHAAFYSLEQSKGMTTIQGGVAVTNDDELGEALRAYADATPEPDDERIDRLLCMVPLNYYQFKHPQRWWRGDVAALKYGVKRLQSTPQSECDGVQPPGYRARMPGALAAIAANQLGKLDAYNERRREGADRWNERLAGTEYRRPVVVAGSVPTFLRYPVIVEPEKKRFSDWAEKELGVSRGVWFTSHIHPARRETPPGLPNAAEAIARCVNLPTLFV